MAERTPRLDLLVGRLGKSVLARRAKPPLAGSQNLATMVFERRRPALLGSIARLAHGRSLTRGSGGPEPPAEPEVYRPAGMSEFAARWLFGDETPAGIPFSNATAQAVLARSGSEVGGPPSFLREDEAAQRKAEASRRSQPVARGRVEEGPSFRLSRTPGHVSPKEADDPPPEPFAAAPGPERPVLVAEAGHPSPAPPSQPESEVTATPTSKGLVAASRPVSRPAVARVEQATSAPPRPEVAVGLVARAPATVRAALSGVQAAPRKPGLFGRALDVLRPTPRARVDAPVGTSAGIPTASPRVGVARAPGAPLSEPSDPEPDAEWPVTSAQPAVASVEPEPRPAPPKFEREPRPPALARVALEVPHDAFEQGEPPRLAALGKPPEAPGTLAQSTSFRPRRLARRPAGPARSRFPEPTEAARPLVRLGAADAAGLERTLARHGTSAARVAAATGLPLQPGPNGTASVVLAPARLEAQSDPGPALTTAAALALARQEVTAAPPPAPVTVEAPSPKAGPPPAQGQAFDADEVYEQVVERLRRDLLAERERMGDLLGDLRR